MPVKMTSLTKQLQQILPVEYRSILQRRVSHLQHFHQTVIIKIVNFQNNMIPIGTQLQLQYKVLGQLEGRVLCQGQVQRHQDQTLGQVPTKARMVQSHQKTCL